MSVIVVRGGWLKSIILGSLLFVGAIVVAFLALVAATALGQDGGVVPLPDPDPLALGRDAVTALMSKQWLFALIPIINLLVWLIRKLAPAIPWLGTDRGGAIVAILTGVALPIVTAIITGQALNVGLVVTIISVMTSSIGVFVAGKKIIAPSDKVTVPGGGAGGSPADIAGKL